jgi:tetratricopeptide (TPR) repeat protein
MSVSLHENYQKRAARWIIVSAVLLPIFILVAALGSEDSTLLIIGIIGIVFSGVGVLASWLYKIYNAYYIEALKRFEKEPLLLSWKMEGSSWSDYSRVEIEHRKRGLLQYIWWSPLIIGFLAIMLWSEMDELSFDTNLIWMGLGVYTLVMVLLYYQMKRNAHKITDRNAVHIIELKATGVVVDNRATYWGKILMDEHKTRSQAIAASIFLANDDERGVDTVQIIHESRLHYLVINYKANENSKQEIYLPLPEHLVNEVESKIENIGKYVAPVVIQESLPDDKKKFNTLRYVKIIGVVAGIVSFFGWLAKDGIPLYNNWKATRNFDDGLAAYNRGSYDSALYFYSLARQENPEMPEVYLNLGALYSKKGMKDTALHYYDTALQYQPDFEIAWGNKGALLYDLNKPAESNRALQQFARINPQSHEYDLYFGDNYFALQQIDSALFFYKRSYQEDKKSQVLCYMIGLAHFQKQEYDAAAKILEESIAMDSLYTDSYSLLADTYEQLEKKSEASALRARVGKLSGN